jgi:hypothetical protein
MPDEFIQRKHPCGFCNTGHHADCLDEIVYFRKHWLCMCPCKERDPRTVEGALDMEDAEE